MANGLEIGATVLLKFNGADNGIDLEILNK